MPATESSGTQTTTASTEHTLAAPTTAKTRVIILDLVNLTTTNTLEVAIKMPVLSGGVSRNAYHVTISGYRAAGEPILVSVPVPMMHGGSFVIKCTAAIAVPWSVVTLD